MDLVSAPPVHPSLSAEQNDVKVLDFTPSAGTPESQVKAALISAETDSSVVLLIGPGGTGKTTVLHAIERDVDVRRKYHEGISFIQIGQLITFPIFFSELTRSVELPADLQRLTRFAQSTLNEKDQGQAMAVLARHLAGRPMLVILDDIWSAENKVYKLIQILAAEVNAINRGFKLLLSTRFQDIVYTPVTGTSVEVVPLLYCGQTATRILCHHADVDDTTLNTLSAENRNAVNALLEMCSGLPLTLAVAGRAVRLLRSSQALEDSAWMKYWQCTLKSRPVIAADSSTGHESLFDILRSSLASLRSVWPDYMNITPEQAVSSFCVFEKQAKIPLDVVATMWELDPEQAELVMNQLCRSNILSVVHRMYGDSFSYQMHDHIHEFGKYTAEKEGKVSYWHHKLVTNFASRLSIQALNIGDSIAWASCSEELVKDGYMKDNLIRHLTYGAELNDAISLLIDYRWIQQFNSDIKCVPFQKTLADAIVIHAFLKEKETVVEVVEGEGSVTGLLSDLEYLIEVLRMIMPICAANREECTFQLHGRLCTPNGRTTLFDWCLQSIEKFAKRPWVRPMEGMLQKPGSSLKRVLRSNGQISVMSFGPNTDELVIGCRLSPSSTGCKRGGVEILDSVNGRQEAVRQMLTSAGAAAETIFSNSRPERNAVPSLIVSSDEIAALSEFGSVTVWRGQKKVRDFNPVGSPNEATYMVLLGKDTIACGSRYGSIYLMDASTWEIQQEISGQISPFAFGEPVSIRSLCGNRDGSILISLSANGSVDRWDPKSGVKLEWMSRPPSGATCVAVNPEGRLMAISTIDNRVHICDATSGECKKSVVGHRGNVTCLLFSHDGRMLYSGGADKTIQCWDVFRGNRIGSPMRFHRAKICALVQSPDGTELFSASEDRICVSRARPQSESSEFGMESGFGSKVQAFCLSHDNRTIVTVESDAIRFRDLRDPITRYEALRQMSCYGGSEEGGVNFESLRLGINETVDNVELVALDDDSKLLAYSVREMNLLDEDNDRTQIYIAQRRDRHSWSKGRKAPEISMEGYPELRGASVEKLEFLADDGLEVVFQPELGREQTRLVLRQRWVGMEEAWEWGNSDGSEMIEGLEWAMESGGLSVKMGQLVTMGGRTVGTLDVQAMEHRDMRGASAPQAVRFDSGCGRLWVLNKEGRLQYVDVVDERSARESLAPAGLARLRVGSGAGTGGEGGKTRKRECEVFISCAEADRAGVGMALGEVLGSRGVEWVVGQEGGAEGEMGRGLGCARVAVVVTSAEYAGRGRTMRELEVVERRWETGEMGVVGVFYRLGMRECRGLNVVRDVRDGEGDERERERFERMISEGAKEVWEMRARMRRVVEEGRVVENREGARNGGGSEMAEKRRRLVRRVAEAVVDELAKVRRHVEK